MLDGKLVTYICDRALKEGEWQPRPTHCFDIGDDVEVVRGRKIPKGSIGKIIKIKKSIYATPAEIDLAGTSEMLLTACRQNTSSCGISGLMGSSCVLLNINGVETWTSLRNLKRI